MLVFDALKVYNFQRFYVFFDLRLSLPSPCEARFLLKCFFLWDDLRHPAMKQPASPLETHVLRKREREVGVIPTITPVLGGRFCFIFLLGVWGKGGGVRAGGGGSVCTEN